MSPSSSWLQSRLPGSPTGLSRTSALRSTANLRGSKSLSWLHGAAHKELPSGPSADATGNKYALVAVASRASLQQTARSWLASYDKSLSQNFWCQHDGVPSSLENQRLPPVASHTARRENYKKQHYVTEIDRIVTRSRLKQGRSKEDAARGRTVSLEDLEKETVKSGTVADEVEKLVQEAAHRHRHFKPQKLEYQKELTKREEKVEEPAVPSKGVGRMRKKKAAQPGNPKWRVEERIKWARKQWKESGEPPETSQNLPMTQFSVQGEHGKEEHALVDVRAVQGKCKGLSITSAKSLLEQQRLREEEAATKKLVDQTRSQAEIDAFAALTWGIVKDGYGYNLRGNSATRRPGYWKGISSWWRTCSGRSMVHGSVPRAPVDNRRRRRRWFRL